MTVGVEWREVDGYGGDYLVSNRGELCSLKGRRPRLLRGHINPDGYRVAFLSGGSGGKRIFFFHRLALEAFVGECPEGMVARHLNGVPDDNRLENLTYGTESENAHDRVRHGRDKNTAKTHCPQGHPYIGTNLYVHPKGKRVCRACARASAERHRRRKGMRSRA